MNTVQSLSEATKINLKSCLKILLLCQDHIQEVLNKWQSIDDEIWAKIIVLERNRRVAKVCIILTCLSLIFIVVLILHVY